MAVLQGGCGCSVSRTNTECIRRPISLLLAQQVVPYPWQSLVSLVSGAITSQQRAGRVGVTSGLSEHPLSFGGVPAKVYAQRVSQLRVKKHLQGPN